MRATAPNLTLKQYFTDTPEINSAMASLLGNTTGATVLEPSVGNGSLLSVLQGQPRRIDAIDIDPAVLALAKQRLRHLPIETHCVDFIDIHVRGLLGAGVLPPSGYDAVISNPPFGLYFSQEYRRQLKRAFPELYVRESYGLFFIMAVSLLRPNGRYVFLIPDTFLTSKNHAPLRRFIRNSATIKTIVRFPSKRFETVNFGYGNLCIVSGAKKPLADDDRIRWIDSFDGSHDLLSQPETNRTEFSGREWRAHTESGWRRGMANQQLEHADWIPLGSLADCKTGIYTGDNQRFLGYDPARVNKRLNGHAIQWNRDTYLGPISEEQKLNGLDSRPVYVPLVRGGHRNFDEAPAWAIRWDTSSVAFYRNDKKARLQNADFYFRSGIAVPMVTSRRLTASLMDNAVFDQGVVGVFPKNEQDREALLLYLNSSVATKIRNDIVNGGANNSANYLKKLVVPCFSEQSKSEAKNIIGEAIKRGSLSQAECDNFVKEFTTPDRT